LTEVRFSQHLKPDKNTLLKSWTRPAGIGLDWAWFYVCANTI